MRLEKGFEFSRATRNSRGFISQIGDNDSGVFFKLEPHQFPLEENFEAYEFADLHHEYLDALESAIFRDNTPHSRHKSCTSLVATSLSGGVVPFQRAEIAQGTGSFEVRSKEWKVSAFEDFGLYIYSLEKVRVTVRCGDTGQDGNGGHAHNDALSFGLDYSGIPIFADAGTFTYTRDAHQRNRFRSTALHSTLSIEGVEQNRWRAGFRGLFHMYACAFPQCTTASAEEFVGFHVGYGKPTERRFCFRKSEILVQDHCTAKGLKFLTWILDPRVTVHLSEDHKRALLKTQAIAVELWVNSGKLLELSSEYSPAYGVKFPSKMLRLPMSGASQEWGIRWPK
jgi:hypothetical protein